MTTTATAPTNFFDAITAALDALRAQGFTGEPIYGPEGTGAPIFMDVAHAIAIRGYRFPDGTVRLYAEAAEWHDGAYAARIWALPEAVHLLQNVSEREFYAIGGREDPEACRTGCGTGSILGGGPAGGGHATRAKPCPSCRPAAVTGDEAREARALYHAEQGDVFVAYDEANDARYGLAVGAVCVVAWLATLANLGAHERAMRLDCASTEGEQLAIVETREAPRCVGCGDTGFVQVPGHPGEPPENVLCACQQPEEARRC